MTFLASLCTPSSTAIARASMQSLANEEKLVGIVQDVNSFADGRAPVPTPGLYTMNGMFCVELSVSSRAPRLTMMALAVHCLWR